MKVVYQKPVEGDVVCARCEDGVYRRARLVQLFHVSRGSYRSLDRLEVFLLDEGNVELVRPGDLVAMPPDLGLDKIPPAATAVVVAGLEPNDNDPDYSIAAAMYVSRHLVHANNDQDIACRGRVVLAIGNTIWLDRCEKLYRQPNIGTFIIVFETKRDLLSSGYAVETSGHMEPLYALAARAGIERPRLEETTSSSTVFVKQAVKIRTAFLDKEGTTDVYMSECFSPEHFYLQVGE